jgi:branched-chain amino acid aminotransferase
MENLSLHPSASVFHYALECFEGMKAYSDAQGRVRLFRPDMNMKRLASSAQRLCLPPIEQDAFLACIEELVRIDRRFIPQQRGYSLYIRPTIIATTPWLGVGPTASFLFFTILSPVGPYYPSGFKPVQLFAETTRVRAAEGGTGHYKLGSNYAGTILPQVEAAAKGYSQVLWLYGKEHELTEVGTMNLFMFWINDKGEKELLTPPLDGTILPGVTRDSILQLTRQWGEFKVTERKFYMAEVVRAIGQGRVLEMFGAGTAAIVSPINLIGYMGADYKVPLDKSNPNANAGPLATRLSDTIMSIQYGDVQHQWSKVID